VQNAEKYFSSSFSTMKPVKAKHRRQKWKKGILSQIAEIHYQGEAV
jgi:hypothetical protein